MTPWQDGGSGHVRYLDRHTLDCPDKHALTKYTLDKHTDGRIRFEFECCSIYRSALAIRRSFFHETSRTIEHGENIYLDRQVIKCPGDNQLIKSMQMRSTTGLLWFRLTCYELASGYGLTRSWKNSASFSNASPWKTYAFDQVAVDCNSGLGVEFILESRFRRDISTNPESGFFALSCAVMNTF